MKKARELYFNIFLYEECERHKADIPVMLTLISNYIKAHDSYDVDINTILNDFSKTTDGDVAKIAKLITNKEIEYTMSSNLTNEEIENFINDSLDWKDRFDNIYEAFIEDETLTYDELMDGVLHDSKLKPYNPNTYVEEVRKNKRVYEENFCLEESLCKEIAYILNTFNPHKIAKDETEYKILCEFIVNIYIRVLLTMNTCLKTLQEETPKFNKNTRELTAIIGFGNKEDYQKEIIERLFGTEHIVDEDEICSRVVSLFHTMEYYFVRILDILCNGGNVIPEITYKANICKMDEEMQDKTMEYFNFLQTNYPKTLVSNNLNLVRTSTKKVQRKKKPKTFGKRK